MPGSFDLLRERLLQGGVRPRHAQRYLAELKDHLADLVAEERQAATGPQHAEARAMARLGNVDVLAGAMIARRELHSWSSKAPVATYVIAPTVALAACAALAMGGLVMTVTSLRGGAGGALPNWSPSLAGAVVGFCNFVLPVVLGWALAATAIRQRSRALWPVLGIVVLAAVGALVELQVTLPSATAHGEIGLSPSFGQAFSHWTSFAWRLVLNLTLTLTPYLGFSLSRGGDRAEA
ncbi:MAG TPA: hypothetical protein VFW13_02110 [Phenylobacterium sp.]|nr:hypothetical protein [Phenylobacterium sp.]